MKFTSALLILLLLLATEGMAQKKSKDTAPADSAKLYIQLEKVSQRTWFTRTMHNLFFKPVLLTRGKGAGRYRKLATQAFGPYQGHVIRSIRIVTIDPFGHDVYDTLRAPTMGTERFGNAIHIKTLKNTVNDLLLIKEGGAFDSLLVKESERLLRQELHVQEVFFYPQKHGRDSVDLLIRVLDSWSLFPLVGISGTRFSNGFREHNLMGLNHVMSVFYTWNYRLDRHAVAADYLVRNIRNTYVNTRLSFKLEEQGDHRAGVEISRPFYSTVTRWAAGLEAFEQVKTDTVYVNDSTISFPVSRSIPQEYWVARAFRVSKGHSEDDRATNLILATGVSSINYIERPAAPFDTLRLYRNRAFFRLGIGLSTRKYVRDRYIFNYGFIEDIPVGRSFGIIGGYQMRVQPRWYVGLHYLWGNYFRWGYLSGQLEYGNFFRAGVYEQGVFKGGINYFTGLLETGKWKFRQFVKSEFVIGISPLAADNITLNEGRGGIRGFNSALFSGTHRILLTLQTQVYAPWRFLGFGFGPYINCTLGWLGNSSNGFTDARPHTQIGLGFLINNRYLMFENFEVSVSIYPPFFGTDQPVIVGNAFRTTDFGFPDYGLANPKAVTY